MAYALATEEDDALLDASEPARIEFIQQAGGLTHTDGRLELTKPAGADDRILRRPAAPLYVEMVGGKEPIMVKRLELHKAGKYFEASENLKKLFFANPSDQEVKDLLADVYEQIGYQQEKPSLRNSFLSGAYELRTGIPQGDTPSTAGPDVIRAMSTELFLDYLTIKMDTRKAEGLEFTMNLVTPDNGQKFAIELSKATLTNVEGFEVPNADLTLKLKRSDLELVMIGETEFKNLLADGRAKAEGDVSVLAKLASTMVEFDSLFEVLPGTKNQQVKATERSAYKAVTGTPIAE